MEGRLALNKLIDPRSMHAAERADIFELRDRVRQVLARLTFRSQLVLRLRFGIGEPFALSLQDTARALSMTVHDVLIIETRSLQRLRRPCHTRSLQDWAPEGLSREGVKHGGLCHE